jgi:hypothetical protein
LMLCVSRHRLDLEAAAALRVRAGPEAALPERR